jgi:hypothetical protein
MFTHFTTKSSRTSAIVIVGVKRILFPPQDIEQKISTFNGQSIKMKEQSTLSAIYRVLTLHLRSPLNSMIPHILGRLKANLLLNNVNCVKYAIFENYFEQISHFSTV